MHNSLDIVESNKQFTSLLKKHFPQILCFIKPSDLKTAIVSNINKW